MRRTCKAIVFAGLGIFFLGLADSSFAATVQAVSKRKRAIKISEGPEAGFEVGAKACVYKPNDGPKIGCGYVTKAKKGKALVVFDDVAIVRRIKKGYEVRSGGGQAIAAAGTIGIRAFYLGGFLTPTRFNRVAWVGSGGTTTLWAKDNVIANEYVGFGGAIDVQAASWLGLALGGRYRLAPDLSITSEDSDSGASGEILVTYNSRTTYGGWIDAFVLNLQMGPVFGARAGLGLDLEMSSMTVTATRSDADLISGDLGLNVISLRIPAEIHLTFGAIGIFGGAYFMLPIAVMGESNSLSANTTDTTISQYAQDYGSAEDDFAAAIDYTKASFALDLVAGAAVRF